MAWWFGTPAGEGSATVGVLTGGKKNATVGFSSAGRTDEQLGNSAIVNSKSSGTIAPSHQQSITTTSDSSNVPLYRAVNIWRRTS